VRRQKESMYQLPNRSSSSKGAEVDQIQQPRAEDMDEDCEDRQVLQGDVCIDKHDAKQYSFSHLYT
jgi:hypothetical protein